MLVFRWRVIPVAVLIVTGVSAAYEPPKPGAVDAALMA